MFRRSSIRRKLTILIVLPIIGLIGLSLLAWRTIDNVGFGSTAYAEIAESKALVLDLEQPGQVATEAYLVVNLLATAEDLSRRGELIVEFAAHEDSFYATYQQWVVALADADKAELRTLLLETSFEPADAFFKAVHTDFLPLVQTGDLDRARDVINNDLDPLYAAHVAAAADALTAAEQLQRQTEANASAAVGRGKVFLVAGLLLLALIISSLAVAFGKGIVNAIQALIARADRSATVDLPAAVAAIQLGHAPSVELESLAVEGDDELAELARSFNAMQHTSVDLASEQALLRRNVSDMFVNLGRRNQSLLNRTLAFITELERNERNPQTLDDLFRLDHLTTRMRRNAESLLVLAGAESARSWSHPVDAADVVRSALSEIESYDRVDLAIVDDVRIRGHAVADVAHLLAELIENATVYSPPDTRVNVVGRGVPSGFVLSVVDEGIGMTSDEITEANRRIEETTRFDVSPSKVLGLFVVGRLAARHGIAVRLVESVSDGLTAKVHLPTALLDGATMAADQPEEFAGSAQLVNELPSSDFHSSLALATGESVAGDGADPSLGDSEAPALVPRSPGAQGLTQLPTTPLFDGPIEPAPVEEPPAVVAAPSTALAESAAIPEPAVPSLVVPAAAPPAPPAYEAAELPVRALPVEAPPVEALPSAVHDVDVAVREPASGEADRSSTERLWSTGRGTPAPFSPIDPFEAVATAGPQPALAPAAPPPPAVTRFRGEMETADVAVETVDVSALSAVASTVDEANGFIDDEPEVGFQVAVEAEMEPEAEPVTDEFGPELDDAMPPLQRRVRGASLPDMGTPAEPAGERQKRTAEDVRHSLSSFQSGGTRARQLVDTPEVTTPGGPA